jgi:serine/threonine-protein kinase
MGRYRLESLLGRGGMGSVWRAEHLGLKSPVAIKVLDQGVAGDDLMLSRFMREAQSAAALRSPHVVQIFDHGVDDGKAFIAMELLNGESLGDRIARVGGLPGDEALRFLTEVLRAIHKAHEAGIVHRDLKPDNIFIVKDEPEFAKVLDFGVAKVQKGDFASSGASKTQTGMMIGTPYYMSPEQTQAKDVDQRSDLWAIAIIAFEALTGKRPFTGDSFGELVIAICTSPVPIPSSLTKVPRGFDEWFVRGTQRDKARRFQSAREMADELVKIATGTTGPMRAIPSISTPRTGPVPAVSTPGSNTASSSTPPGEKPDQLELTTGQRSAVVSSSSRPRPAQSPALLALLGMAALIVIGVGVFVMTGGARAFREREAAKEVEKAAATQPPAPGPVAAQAPILPEPVPEKATAEFPAPPVSAPAAAAPASAVASASPKAKATPAPAKTPARSAASAAPARPSSKDPLPPKHWDF